jgi:hypothetical protein
MFDECVAEGQSARRVPEGELVAQVRAEIRRLARTADVRIRTARMDDAVVAVRLDAQVWNEDAVTMRQKLTPPA